MKQKILEHEGDMDSGIDHLLKSVEQQVGHKIFTIRIGETDKTNDTSALADILIVFEDKSILEGQLIISFKDNTPAINIKANFI